MEKLNEYLKGRKAGAFAAQVGISQGHLSDIRNGRREPSFAVARAIRDASGGFVGLDDWYGDVDA